MTSFIEIRLVDRYQHEPMMIHLLHDFRALVYAVLLNVYSQSEIRSSVQWPVPLR
jgi:hypothetical protein